MGCKNSKADNVLEKDAGSVELGQSTREEMSKAEDPAQIQEPDTEFQTQFEVIKERISERFRSLRGYAEPVIEERTRAVPEMMIRPARKERGFVCC
eukprot:CAMPEP_0194515432 /NCGR_PEP_ID=MMETSP0253-20130528/48115_1 /TAXON_ID=2966 /ORGANISM="Noctiluca scintillans" /LENGTH=95 /DNA_ID=CAMNT_0039359181 /DNA_START=54 /DNA_END=341 /DNA_ORIENTATION=-